jgi:hypothetical protein
MTPIEKSLQTINESSLAKICFFNKPFDKFIEELDFYNIIFAGNGMFIALKNEFGIAIDENKNIKYTNTLLNNIDKTIAIYPLLPKPNISIFIKIIEIFKYVYDKIKSEVCVNVYYHKTNKTFHVNIEDQIVSKIKATYDYNENFEMSSDYIRYLQIHSHHSMSAAFSAIDDKDENFTTLCYYGVVGKLNKDSSFYNIDSKFRIWNGIRFLEISFGDIFDIGVNTQKLTESDLCRLNMIIEKSELEKNQLLLENKFKRIGLPIITSQFTDEFNTLLDSIQ